MDNQTRINNSFFCVAREGLLKKVKDMKDSLDPRIHREEKQALVKMNRDR